MRILRQKVNVYQKESKHCLSMLGLKACLASIVNSAENISKPKLGYKNITPNISSKEWPNSRKIKLNNYLKR